jgi:hypothetical protein
VRARESVRVPSAKSESRVHAARPPPNHAIHAPPAAHHTWPRRRWTACRGWTCFKSSSAAWRTRSGRWGGAPRAAAAAAASDERRRHTVLLALPAATPGACAPPTHPHAHNTCPHHVLSLSHTHTHAQAREKEKEARRREERRNRDAFRQLLQQHRCASVRAAWWRVHHGMCMCVCVVHAWHAWWLCKGPLPRVCKQPTSTTPSHAAA